MLDETGGDLASIDVIVIGAGFSGLYATYALRERGLTVRAYEAR